MFEQLVGKLNSWGEGLVLMLPNLGVALAILVAAWIASRLIGRAVERALGRVSKHRTLNELIRKLVRFGVLTAGFLVALNVLDLEEAATTFLAGAGIAGLALGFAFQDLSANFISGVAMAINAPMRTGELVETNSYTGIIEHIELRSTLLRTLDGRMVLIPNRKVFENVLVNFSRLGRRRVEIKVGVSYQDDLTRAREVAIAAVATVEPRLDEPVELFYEEFSDSSVVFLIRFWIAFHEQLDYLAARDRAIVAIRRAFGEAGITIPYPIRTLDLGDGKALRELLGSRVP